jgi:hypothetical protein
MLTHVELLFRCMSMLTLVEAGAMLKT